MSDQPRRRAQINGLYVSFESRNPKLASVRWHSRFKLRYRTKADSRQKRHGSTRGGLSFRAILRSPSLRSITREPESASE